MREMEITKPYDIKNYSSNISYILKENSNFSTTEFRVLINQNNSCFVSCYKLQLNGRIQLLYLSENYVPLNNLLPNIESGNCMAIISDLINNVLSIRKNGFLSCQNIDTSLENIFVDPTTNQSKIIYLPLSTKLYTNSYAFERCFKDSINRIIHSAPKIPSSRVVEISKLLLDDSTTLEDIYTSIYSIYSPDSNKTERSRTNKRNRIVLTSINTPNSLQLTIDKDDYVIGRKESAVDGYIGFSKMVGRKHCKISIENNLYYLIDLQSSNGTYLNGRRIPANQPIKIGESDRIKIANVEFLVELL